MSGYGQFCPVAKGAEVFAERWTPLILRELLCGSHQFNQLQRGVPRMSHSLLAQRLRALERAGIVERRPAPTGRGGAYHLTPAGAELAQVVEPLGAWGQRWAVDQLGPDDLDPALLLWALHRDLHLDRLPQRRVVVQFDFPDRPKERVWLILQRPEVEVCIKDYGLDVDLLVTADLLALTRVYLGRLDLLDALKAGLVELDGPLELRRAFPSWIGVSAFARYGHLHVLSGRAQRHGDALGDPLGRAMRGGIRDEYRRGPVSSPMHDASGAIAVPTLTQSRAPGRCIRCFT